MPDIQVFSLIEQADVGGGVFGAAGDADLTSDGNLGVNESGLPPLGGVASGQDSLSTQDVPLNSLQVPLDTPGFSPNTKEYLSLDISAQADATVNVPGSTFPVNPPFNTIFDYSSGNILVTETISLAFKIPGSTPFVPVTISASGQLSNSEPVIEQVDGVVGGGDIHLFIASGTTPAGDPGQVYVDQTTAISFTGPPDRKRRADATLRRAIAAG